MIKFILIITVCIPLCTSSDYDLWKKFKEEHQKFYVDSYEEIKRYNIFQSNLRKIEEHNIGYENGESQYFLGITYFADMSQDEIYQRFNQNEPLEVNNVQGNVYEKSAVTNVPDEFDWRTKGVVNEIRNQLCGDGWAFATCGILESQYAINYGHLISLSPQNLVDCTVPYGNYGCGRGYYNTTFQYLKENGIESDTAYPYYGLQQNCTFDSSRSVLKVNQLIHLPKNDEEALKEAVATVGPIGVFLDATYMTLYKGGLYNTTYCDNSQNHAVLVIGYGQDEGQDYWLIKNSWGTAWGEKGYMKLARNANNLCGVAVQPTYITIV